MENWDCCGSGPHVNGEVRLLPSGGDSNMILCHSCYCRELLYRQERNRELGSYAFQLPDWYDLEVYQPV